MKHIKHIIIAAVCAVMLSGCGGATGDISSEFADIQKANIEFQVCGLTVRWPNTPIGEHSLAEMREAMAAAPELSHMLNQSTDSEFCRNWLAAHQLGLKQQWDMKIEPPCVQIDDKGLYGITYYYVWGVEHVLSTACP